MDQNSTILSGWLQGFKYYGDVAYPYAWTRILIEDQYLFEPGLLGTLQPPLLSSHSVFVNFSLDISKKNDKYFHDCASKTGGHIVVWDCTLSDYTKKDEDTTGIKLSGRPSKQLISDNGSSMNSVIISGKLLEVCGHNWYKLGSSYVNPNALPENKWKNRIIDVWSPFKLKEGRKTLICGSLSGRAPDGSDKTYVIARMAVQ